MVSDMNAIFSYFLICAICTHAHSYNLYCSQELLHEASLKRSWFLGVVLSGGKSVNKELMGKNE